MFLNFIQTIKLLFSYSSLSYVGSLTVHSVVLWGFLAALPQEQNSSVANPILKPDRALIAVNLISLPVNAVDKPSPPKILKDHKVIHTPQIDLKNKTKNQSFNKSLTNMQNSFSSIEITPYATNALPAIPSNIRAEWEKYFKVVSLVLKLSLNSKGYVNKVICLTPNIDQQLEKQCIKTAQKWRFHIKGPINQFPISVEVPINFEYA